MLKMAIATKAGILAVLPELDEGHRIAVGGWLERL
jgi:hypothetical protein